MPPPERRTLRAGPVTVELVDGDLRYARVGDTEAARRIYVGVRDLNWNTIPGSLESYSVDEGPDSFSVRFRRQHRAGPIAFAWDASIRGLADGTLEYHMDGRAVSGFSFAKIGICVHHAIRETAGRPYRGHGPGGDIEGHLPDLIGPQIPVADGTHLPLFDPVVHLEIDPPVGGTVSFDFEGDLFEMEDQRNWSDGSLKTYSTPASLGYRFEATPGQRITQKVVVHVARVPVAKAVPLSSDRVRLSIDPGPGTPLPTIGLGMSSETQSLPDREVGLLRALGPSHLRVDLHLRDGVFLEELRRASLAAGALACPLEVAAFVEDVDRDLSALASALRDLSVPVRRLVMLSETEESTPAGLVDRARGLLADLPAPVADFVGGTNVYFCELNRSRPPTHGMDGIAYSINPQIHAFDELSLVEALEAEADTVRTAKAVFGGLPVIVSPVTLRPRFNAVAATDEEESVGELPSSVDVRQGSLFGAGWTVGSLKYLAEAGAASVTYFETVGWRGIMERDEVLQRPAVFPSDAGTVFPIYHVLADVLEFRGGSIRETPSSDPLATIGLAVHNRTAFRLLIANLTEINRRVAVEGLPSDEVVVRELDERSAHLAAHDPERFRRHTVKRDSREGVLELELRPYAVVRVDASGGSDASASPRRTSP